MKSKQAAKRLSYCLWLPVLMFWIALPLSFRFAEAGSGDRYLKWAHEQSSLKPDPTIVFGKLPNGFRYALKENSTPLNRSSMHLYVHAGSVHESDDQQGLAHFLEHMLFCGTTHFPPGELIKYFQRIGMKFGPDANAYTGFFQTVYDVLLPDSQEQTILEGLKVMKDYSEGALLLESEIDRERKVVLAEMITRDSASYRTFVKSLSFELPDSIIPKRFPIGIEEVLKRIDRKSMKQFYDTWYRPELLVLIMAGDFKAQQVEDMIKKEFSSLSPRLPAADFPNCGSVSHKGIKLFYHYEQELGNTRISIEAIRNNPFDSDSLERRKEHLFKRLGNRIIQNRLDNLLKTPDAPFTSAAIYFQEYYSFFEIYEITAETDPTKWKESLSILEQTLRNALENGFTQSELDRVKKEYIAELDMDVEKESTRESSTIADQLISSIGSNSVLLSPQQQKEMLTPLIQSASPELIHQRLKRGWGEDHRLVLLSGNLLLDAAEKTPEDQILEVFSSSTKIPVKKPEESAAAAFPYLPKPEIPGEILKVKEEKDLDMTQIDFKNGIRLNMKKTDFEANSVKVILSFGIGRSGEPVQKPGLGEFSESVINESGTGKLNKEELSQTLAGSNVSVSFQVNEDCFSFEGACLTKEMTLLFQVLHAYIADPGLRENAVALTKERFLQQYKALSQSIDGAALLHGDRFLAGGDGRFGFPSEQEIKNYSLEDIREWILTSIHNDPLEISIVGDFDTQLAQSLTGLYFGSMKKRQQISTADPARKPLFPSGKSLNLSVKTDINKSMIIAAYPTEDIWNIARSRRLSALSSVFSERLRVKIREEMGAAYSSYAYHSPSRAYPGYGMMKAVIQVKPDDVDAVVKEIQHIASELEKGITQDEFKRAVDPIITGIKDMMRTNDYWLKRVLLRSVDHPEQLEWSRTFIADYQTITPDEVSKLAKQYLQNQLSAVTTIKPEKK